MKNNRNRPVLSVTIDDRTLGEFIAKCDALGLNRSVTVERLIQAWLLNLNKNGAAPIFETIKHDPARD